MSEPDNNQQNSTSPAPGGMDGEQYKTVLGIAPNLDPDIAKAVLLDSNPTIILAIASGARTNQEVAMALIRMGATTGLPPGVQEIVTQQQKDLAARRADEDAYERRKAAELAGAMFMVGGLGAKLQTDGPEGAGRSPESATLIKPINLMTGADIGALTETQWQSMTHAQRRELVEKVSNDAVAKGEQVDATKKSLDAEVLADERFGQTEADRARNLVRYKEAAQEMKFERDLGKVRDELTKDGFNQIEQDQILKYREQMLAERHAADAQTASEAAQKQMNATPDDPDNHALRSVKDATYQMQQANSPGSVSAEVKHAEREFVKALEEGNLGQGNTAKVEKSLSEMEQSRNRSLAAAAAKSNSALGAAAQTLTSSGDQQALLDARDQNFSLRQEKDTATDAAQKAELVAQGTQAAGFGVSFDEPAAPQAAAVSTQAQSPVNQASINVGDPPKVGPNSPVLAQLGAPANNPANDPAPPPEPERKLAASGPASPTG